MPTATLSESVRDAISMTQAARLLDCHVSTVWRYWNPGVRGVRLETFLVGAKRKTTRAALEKFLVALNRDNPSTISAVPAGNASKALEALGC